MDTGTDWEPPLTLCVFGEGQCYGWQLQLTLLITAAALSLATSCQEIIRQQ
jgi:hypothetical protein